MNLYSQQNMFLQRGHSRGDETAPSGSHRFKGSVGRGKVFVVDEDTDLLDPIFHNGGKVNPQWKTSRDGLNKNQRGKLEQSSKLFKDNITADKKTNSSGRTSSLFLGKSSDDVIDLDIETTTKKPSMSFPMIPKIPLDPRISTDSNKLRKVTNESSRFDSLTTHIIISGPSAKGDVEGRKPITTDHKAKHDGKLPDKEYPGRADIIYRHGDLVLGLDGKRYQLQRGPPGQMGPPGQDVSELNFLLQ